MKIAKDDCKKTATELVKSIREGDNVTAYKALEKLMKQKMANRLEKVLKDVE